MLEPRQSTLKSILVVDDEENLRHMLKMVLERAGYVTTAVGNVDEALIALKKGRHDIVLTDLRMPHRSGLELVQAIKEGHPKTYVVLMTAYGSVDVALEAMGRGAYDYISKPFKPGELLLTLRKIEEREGLLQENRRLKAHLKEETLDGLVGASEGMVELSRLARKFAKHKTTVFLTGESGTGKDVMAHNLHRLSNRKDGPFIAVNCAAIPEALLESELFGHSRGAFTGAVKNKIGLFMEADGGTLFLDEIGDLPLSLQSKLLRALESGEIRPVGETRTQTVDVRILCATARNVQKLVAEGAFREDLFYRINVLSLHLPSLRSRSDDIPMLVQHFLESSLEKAGRETLRFSRSALVSLMDYPWPGNVRELKHAVERAVILADGLEIEAEDLPPAVLKGRKKLDAESTVIEATPKELSIKKETRSLEQRLIKAALQETKGNRTHAAALLEISHRTLLYKMKEYGIDASRQS